MSIDAFYGAVRRAPQTTDALLGGRVRREQVGELHLATRQRVHDEERSRAQDRCSSAPASRSRRSSRAPTRATRRSRGARRRRGRRRTRANVTARPAAGPRRAGRAASSSTRRSTLPPSRSRPPPPPPKSALNIAMRARNMIAIAMAAATDEIRMSRCRTCEISCASTPRSSSWFTTWSRPWVTATAACSGLRPVANAFGCCGGADVDLGHRHAGPLCEVAHDRVELRRFLLGDGLRAGGTHRELGRRTSRTRRRTRGPGAAR